MKAKFITMWLVALASALSLSGQDVDNPAATQGGRKSGETRTVTLPGGAKMEMIWCAPGTFCMGSPPGEQGRISNETLHSVTLTRGFWLGKYEVTQSQWGSVMRSNHSRFKHKNNPVENISWHDCEAFMKRIGPAFGGKARLPTEAEWEYACRAGSNTPFSGSGVVSEVAWYDENSEHQTHEVGKNKPNAWGFYDMHGNILEWCSDWYSEPKGDSVDPKGPPSGSFKVLRGGCWFFLDSDCRCAYRLKREPNLRNCIFGFRVASFDFDDMSSATSIQQK
jgi:formylglycine-generating enzyme required for sulfatase activity